MAELTIDATVTNLETVINFVDSRLKMLNCPEKTQMQIRIAIDELFGNIAHYAYKPDVGPATIRVETDENQTAVVITFLDRGTPYNPLKHREPDITLLADERQEGGLGIYMVKKTMDEVTYEYRNGQNVLTIRKNL